MSFCSLGCGNCDMAVGRCKCCTGGCCRSCNNVLQSNIETVVLLHVSTRALQQQQQQHQQS
eukprot:945689-Heterocapsa_arctica.AAC.1